MATNDVDTDELLKLIHMPVPPRPLGRKTAPRKQFEQFLRDMEIKRPRKNARLYPAGPIFAFYAWYRDWRAHCSPLPPLIGPRRFANYMRKYGFNRTMRSCEHYHDRRNIGADYTTALRLAEFLAEHPLTKQDAWLCDPRSRWRNRAPPL